MLQHRSPAALRTFEDLACDVLIRQPFIVGLREYGSLTKSSVWPSKISVCHGAGLIAGSKFMCRDADFASPECWSLPFSPNSRSPRMRLRWTVHTYAHEPLPNITADGDVCGGGVEPLASGSGSARRRRAHNPVAHHANTPLVPEQKVQRL
jgi:hypothetical protein